MEIPILSNSNIARLEWELIDLSVISDVEKLKELVRSVIPQMPGPQMCGGERQANVGVEDVLWTGCGASWGYMYL